MCKSYFLPNGSHFGIKNLTKYAFQYNPYIIVGYQKNMYPRLAVFSIQEYLLL